MHPHFGGAYCSMTAPQRTIRLESQRNDRIGMRGLYKLASVCEKPVEVE